MAPHPRERQGVLTLDTHRNVRWLAVALLIALIALCPPSDQAGAQEVGSVRLTFELYLSGDVPEGELFRLEFLAPRPQPGGSGIPLLYLCGGPRGELEGPFGPPLACVGREEPYTGIRGGPKGATVTYRFFRVPEGGRQGGAETVSKGTLRLEEDATIVAHYRYPGGEKPGVPSELPDTGAGGLAPGTTIPLGNAATGLVMLAGAGYAVLRRR